MYKFTPVNISYNIAKDLRELTPHMMYLKSKDWIQNVLQDKVDSVYKMWSDNVWLFEQAYEKHRALKGEMKYFDGNGIFWDKDSITTIGEKILSYEIFMNSLHGDIDQSRREIAKVAAYSPPTLITELEDVASFTGKATSFMGLWGTSVTLDYFQPRSTTKLIDLTDTLGYYPNEPTLLYMNTSSQLVATDFQENKRFRVETYASTGLITATTIGGSDLNRTFWSLNIGTSDCTSFEITLDAPDFDGATFIFKVSEGDATDIQKRLLPGAGLSFMNGSVPRYVLNSQYAIMLAYDASNNTFWKTEGHIV